jgi:hypothetical protein
MRKVHKKHIYIHEVYRFGWLRFSFYRLANQFCIRFEISNFE